MFCSLIVNAQQYFTDPDDLKDAVNATSGGTYIVTDGTFNDFEASFEIVATAESPIINKAASVDGVTLIEESHFVFKKSAYATLEIDGERSKYKVCIHKNISCLLNFGTIEHK